jgi:serine phosphatase RsbU (regulator of sigma subunit)/Tfp pilus assembly protein PilF
MRGHRSFSLVFCFLFSLQLMGQDPFPELTRKISGFSLPSSQIKIESIYQKEISKRKDKVVLLLFWKYCLFDSLGFTDARDGLCLQLYPALSSIDHLKTADIYSYMGMLFYEENQYEKGISTLYQGLLVAKKYKDYKRVSSILKDIGVAYRKIGNLKNAKKYLHESLYYASKTNDHLQVGNVCLALGNALREESDNVTALSYFKRSLEIGKMIKSNRLLAGNYNNIGLIEHGNRQYTKALNYFDKALTINKNSGNTLWESFNYLNMGNTYDQLKRYDRAISCYLQSNELKLKLGDSLSLLSGYINLADVFFDYHDPKSAYEYLKKYVNLKNRLNITDQSNLLEGLEAKYESEKKVAQIKRLKMNADLHRAKNDNLRVQSEKNRNISILSILAVISLSVGLGVLWKNSRRRMGVNKLLYIKNDEIEKANESLSIALDKLSLKNKEVIDSINYATYIQQAALPRIRQLSTDRLQFELFFAPKDIVSGDFYFLYHLHQKSIFGVADCTGHGVPGAMVSLVGMNSLDKVVREGNHSSSADMVSSLNDHVKDSLQRGGESINDGMDLSFCVVDHQEQVLHFTGANHSAFVLRSSEEVVLNSGQEDITVRISNAKFSLLELAGERRPIGNSISQKPFFEVTLDLLPRDRIILFSDGFADQYGGEFNKKLKKGVLLSMILESGKRTVEEQIDFLKSSFMSWKGDEVQIDDVCVLIVECK